MKILFASPEAVPFSHSGPVAEIASGLCAALSRRGHQVTLVTPRYRCVDVGGFDLRRRRARLALSVSGRVIQGGILDGNTPAGVPVLFIDQPTYFDRDGLYGAAGKEFEDNDERFAFFCRAVLESCHQVGLAPDIIHGIGWQSGPVPAMLQVEFRERVELNKTGTVFTLHDATEQGLFAPESMMALGLDWNLFTPSTLEFFGKLSYLKAALVFSDKLTAVSKRYASEVQRPAFAQGLETVLVDRSGDLRGILHGVDYAIWDPKADSHIAATYSPENTAGKVACKSDLQQRLGLPVDPSFPVVACLSPWTPAQGLELFLQAAAELLPLRCQWIFHGHGDPALEQQLKALANGNPQKLAVETGADEVLTHRLLAGSDLLLCPAISDPSGSLAMMALRYGSVPVVHGVGGLDEAIENLTDGEGNGFKFDHPTAANLGAAVRRALAVFENKIAWRKLMELGMTQDFSWDSTARRYEAIYREVVAMRTA